MTPVENKPRHHISRTPISISLLILFCAGGISSRAAELPSYTACNIWHESRSKFYAINFKIGKVIPAGTKVSRVRTGRDRITFRVDGTGDAYSMTIIARYQGRLTSTDIVRRFFTTKTFDELTTGLTDRELELIREAKIEDGMSKRATPVAHTDRTHRYRS